MLFNSFGYIIFFLPISLVVYFILNRLKLTTAATAWLVMASLFFYSWWNVKYLALIMGSIIFNFAVGSALTKKGRYDENMVLRKVVLIVGIVGDILLLGYYKYTDFFIANINAITGWHLTLQKIILPLGISFFTFTQIAYLVDAYQNKVREYDFLRYSLFVTFFPHLLAGPIIHHKEMMPQFSNLRNRVVNYRNIAPGVYLFCIGLFKKVVIADALSPIATAGFDSMPSLSLIEAWITSLSYTFQLYFDFSAYTDMALGTSLMFNIRLPFNFDSPYKSLNITEFWRRWHMTLSRFLRDYVYIPLGGNRTGSINTYKNIMITFLIGGIWHGAGWTFVFWGFLHGLATVVHRLWSRLNIALPRIVSWFITFNFVNVAWVFFRAKSWDDAIKVLSGMCGLSGIKLSKSMAKYKFLFGDLFFIGDLFFKSVNRHTIYFLILSFVIALYAKNSNTMLQEFKPSRKTAFFAVAIAIYALLSMNKISEFLYFNF